MKNIVIAEFKHETNSFSPHPTDVEAYKSRNCLFGEEIRGYFKGVRNEIGGFFDVFADKEGYRLIPAAALNAMPAGPVTMEVYNMVKDAILKAIREVDHLDGVLLSLHGAMVLEEFDDGEGLLLEAIRKEVGPQIPIIVSLDLHVNMTARMQANADAFFVFDYYPHKDMYETGVAAAQCMYDTLEGKYNPVMRWHKLPMILPYMPTELDAMKKFVDMEHEWETREGVLSINICHGFFSADLVEHGVAVIAVTDNDAGLAQQLADDLAEQIWDARKELVRDFYTIDQAIDEIESSEEGPFVLADVADNPGAGGPADSTHILRRLIERDVQNVAFALMTDPQAVEAAEAAGVGNMVTVKLGGKTCPEICGQPLEITAYVKSITDGVYKNRDEMSQGLTIRLGKTAVLVVGGIEIIVTSVRSQPWDLEVYRSQGIMPQDKKVLVVKSTLHYRNSYQKVAYKLIDVEVPGLAPQSPNMLTYKNCRRPIYPLDEM